MIYLGLWTRTLTLNPKSELHIGPLKTAIGEVLTCPKRHLVFKNETRFDLTRSCAWSFSLTLLAYDLQEGA